MIDNVLLSDCCVCKACESICPKQAIEFQKINKGLAYPIIRYEKCVKCNMCESVCPTKHALQSKELKITAYAAHIMDDHTRFFCTSGGVFWAIAEYAIERGGYVCGAILTDNFEVKHILSNSISDVRRMCGSKYAQSETRMIYGEVKKYLDHGLLVLFSGTPCQIAALHAFIGGHYENLITVDVVCHGVPPQSALAAYIKAKEDKYRSKLTQLQFREKRNGWHRSALVMHFENGKEYRRGITEDAYMRAFLSGCLIKESCFSCKYKNFKAGSDLTLGDFWGAEVLLPEYDDNKGLNIVFVNTNKGYSILNETNVVAYPVPVEKAIAHNQNVIRATNRSELYDCFYEQTAQYGFAESITKMFSVSRLSLIKSHARFFMRCVYYQLRGRENPKY